MAATPPNVVLIAVDSSRQAEAAFNYDPEEFAEEASVRGWDHHRNRIKAIDDKYRWKLNENGLPGKIRTESGKPGDVIVQTACQEKAGLIVVGSRGQGKLRRAIMGSVSDYVLHNSKCPVVICRQKD